MGQSKDHVNKWEQLWIDMPEFEQEQILPHKEIIVRFRNQDDVDKFAALFGQSITEKTKSIWYPKVVRGKVCQHADKVYTDES